jgi:hypothetical protein
VPGDVGAGDGLYPEPVASRDTSGERAVGELHPAQRVPVKAALLRKDVILSMPPELTTITGRAQVMGFFATVPAGGRLDTIRLVRTRAIGRSALAAYLPGKSARRHGYGIMVFTATSGRIATITGFPIPGLFARFGLPPACGSHWRAMWARAEPRAAGPAGPRIPA